MVAFEEAIVSYFVQGADVLGVPKSVAAIYGICFASPDPLSFSEINERLEISAGSISQGLKVLKEVGALKVVSTRDPRAEHPTLNTQRPTSNDGIGGGPSDPLPAPLDLKHANALDLTRASTRSAARAAYYAPDLELRNLVLHWIENRLQTQLKSGQGRVQAITNALPATDERAAEILRDRMHSLKSWHDKAQMLMPVMKGFLKLG